MTWNSRFVPRVLLPALTAIALAPLPAQANLALPTLQNFAQERSVRIESSTAGGTGILVHHQSGRYTVLTAAHVVEDSVPYRVITSDQSEYELTPAQIKTLPNTDLALFTFESSRQHPTAILGDSTQLTLGSPCYTYGFPSLNSRFSLGSVVANVTQPLQNGEGLGCSAAAAPGMSGGPILNSQGQVVGINTIIYFSGDDVLFTAGVSTNRFLELVAGDPRFPEPVATAISEPQSAQGYLLLGRDQSNQGQYSFALQSFRRAIALDPSSSDGFEGLGRSHAKLGNDREAVNSYNRAIALNPSDPILFYNRALSLDRLGLSAEAIANYTHVVTQSPSFALAYHNRGSLYARLKNYPSALQDFNQAIALNPTFYGSFFNRGAIYQSLENIAVARQDYETAIELNPNYAPAYLALGEIQLAQNQPEQALSNLTQAARLAQRQQDLFLLEQVRQAILLLQSRNTVLSQ